MTGIGSNDTNKISLVKYLYRPESIIDPPFYRLELDTNALGDIDRVAGELQLTGFLVNGKDGN